MISSKEKRKAVVSDRELKEPECAKSTSKIRHDYFAEIYANLDPSEEQTFAEVGINTDLSEWPEY